MIGHPHPAYRTGPRRLRVAAMTRLTPDTTHIELADPSGGLLTAYQPGSHLIVTAGEKRNAYSLVDDGINPSAYRISVLRRGAGGGSDWIHDHLHPGDLLEVEGPRSMFAPVLNQRHALLLAGGIGITPVLSHARSRIRLGRSVDILYSYRPGHAAHLDELRELAGSGVMLREAATIEDTIALMRALLSDQPLGTHAYACGPVPFLESYEKLAAEAGWPAARVHLERFVAPEQDPGEPFVARVASTGQTLDVAAGASLLQTLLDAGFSVPHLCRQGVCGECRIPVRARSIEHRDFVLTDDEKAAGDCMLSCVSRGKDIEVLL